MIFPANNDYPGLDGVVSLMGRNKVVLALRQGYGVNAQYVHVVVQYLGTRL